MKNICAGCGFVVDPKTHTKGDTGIELALWLCCLLPGMIYSLWRLTTRAKVCPACGGNEIVPAHTPRGQMLLKQFGERIYRGGGSGELSGLTVALIFFFTFLSVCVFALLSAG